MPQTGPTPPIKGALAGESSGNHDSQRQVHFAPAAKPGHTVKIPTPSKVPPAPSKEPVVITKQPTAGPKPGTSATTEPSSPISDDDDDGDGKGPESETPSRREARRNKAKSRTSGKRRKSTRSIVSLLRIRNSQFTIDLESNMFHPNINVDFLPDFYLEFPNLQTIGGLKPLVAVSHLFVNKSVQEHDRKGFNMHAPEIFELINEKGEFVFQAEVRPHKCLGLCSICPHKFLAILSDSSGEEVLIIESDPGFYGSGCTLTVRGRLEKYGKVRQEGGCCTPDFSLISQLGLQLLKIRPAVSVNCFNLCVPVEYEIYHGEYTTNVGRLSTVWNLVSEEDDAELLRPESQPQRSKRTLSSAKEEVGPTLHMYGACFPADMPVQHKVLVLATIFMVKIFRNE